MENLKSKTGATPLPEVQEVAGGEIIGLVPVKWRGMVNYRDGHRKTHGETETKMISVFENGDVYFEEGGKFIPSQKWFKAAVNRRLAALASEAETPKTIDNVEQG